VRSGAARDVAAAIAASPNTTIRFDEFMRIALYGEHGFYAGSDDGGAGGHAGRRGDFLTAPEVGPLFGAVLARALDHRWVELGRPDPFTVVDVGAGPGTLARGIVAAGPQCRDALRYVAVEVSESQRQSHPAFVTSVTEMPATRFVGVVVANELLDNLPFRLLVFDGDWREAVVADDSGRFVERTAPLDERPPWLPASAPHGARVPWQEEAAEWVWTAKGVLDGGCVIAIDYSRATTAELAQRPWRDWLRTYRRHDRGAHYLTAVGDQDITADVALDQLPPPDSVRTQADFLRQWGIDDLVDEGRREWAANAARPTVASMTMRSRVREAEALLDPVGLGGFTVAEWCR
jgi:SAM-dependent MidA family methyltransferase